MAFTDPHDARTFRRYVTVNADGTIAAVHEFEASVEDPLPLAVEVTDFATTDVTCLTIDPVIAAAIHSAAHDVAKKQQAVAAAQQDAVASAALLTLAQGAARAALSTSVANAETAAAATPVPVAPIG